MAILYQFPCMIESKFPRIEAMLQMTLTIRGKVQRVGFRYSVADFVAQEKLPLVGFVKNMADGSLQVFAQGDIESLKCLHRFCSKGPPRADVREMAEDFVQITKLTFSGFVVAQD